MTTGRRTITRADTQNDEIEAIRAALIEGERSGLSARSPEDIRAAVKKRNFLNG